MLCRLILYYDDGAEASGGNMILNINIKQLSKKGRRVKAVPFEYKKCPASAEELIEATVDIMLEAFRRRQEMSVAGEVEKALSEEDIKSMAEIGKVAFGFIYNEKAPDRDSAVETAKLAYLDGLVRIFINGEDVEPVEGGTPVSLAEGDEITFVRFAMLAGRMW